MLRVNRTSLPLCEVSSPFILLEIDSVLPLSLDFEVVLSFLMLLIWIELKFSLVLDDGNERRLAVFDIFEDAFSSEDFLIGLFLDDLFRFVMLKLLAGVEEGKSRDRDLSCLFDLGLAILCFIDSSLLLILLVLLD